MIEWPSAKFFSPSAQRVDLTVKRVALTVKRVDLPLFHGPGAVLVTVGISMTSGYEIRKGGCDTSSMLLLCSFYPSFLFTSLAHRTIKQCPITHAVYILLFTTNKGSSAPTTKYERRNYYELRYSRLCLVSLYCPLSLSFV